MRKICSTKSRTRLLVMLLVVGIFLLLSGTASAMDLSVVSSNPAANQTGVPISI